VTDLRDADGQGRIKVALPWTMGEGGARFEIWARLATLAAGHQRGSWFIPDKGDEVLVAFQGGDPALPIVIGSMWNGQDRPPVAMDAGGKNDIKTLRTRSGVTIEFNDMPGKSSLTLSTPGGGKVVIEDHPARVTINDQNGGVVRLDRDGMRIEVSKKVSIACADVVVSASKIKLDSAVVEVTGKLKAELVEAKKVISAEYSSGAGNIV
jgi:uncharacterized protein involved in type VI secretion and phage assembly